MRVLDVVLRLLVGLVFLGSAIPKFVGGADSARESLQLSTWFWQFTGVIELIGALALVASLRYGRLALPAGVWLVGLMAGALIAHLRVDDPVSAMIFPAVLLLLSGLISVLAYRRLVTGEFESERGGAVPSVRLEREDRAA